MKLVTFKVDGHERLGTVYDGAIVDLQVLAVAAGSSRQWFDSMLEFLQAGEPALTFTRSLLQHDLLAAAVRLPFEGVGLAAPIPNPSKIVAIGLNYRDHCVEQGIEAPAAPLLFAKFPNSITGPYDSIVIPEGDPQVDYEVELGVVIGKRAKRVNENAALEHVAGYLVVNDVSAREWQFADKQWTRGKSCDTFAPMGPWLTTADEIPEPENLALSTRVNGELLQDSSTNNLIFGVSKLIAYISASITLEPGDVIATGTPPGVGVFRKPPLYLKPGDVVEVQVEKLGALRNRVVGA